MLNNVSNCTIVYHNKDDYFYYLITYSKDGNKVTSKVKAHVFKHALKDLTEMGIDYKHESGTNELKQLYERIVIPNGNLFYLSKVDTEKETKYYIRSYFPIPYSDSREITKEMYKQYKSIGMQTKGVLRLDRGKDYYSQLFLFDKKIA